MKTNLHLSIYLFLSIILLFVLITITHRQDVENRSLKQDLQLLERSLDQSRERDLYRIDSLQSLVEAQGRRNQALKDSLHLLEHQKKHLNKRSNENKAAIVRIADVDSLYREVARHYQ